MMNIRMLPLALVAMLGAGAVAATAHAQDQDQDRDDVAALAALKVSLPEAIATAERQGGGRAVGADISQRNGASRIAVEVAGPQGVTTVTVDGVSGQVVASAAGDEDAD